MSLNQYLQNRSGRAYVLTGIIMVLLVWSVDYLTARLTEGQLSFSIFYLLPILFITWYGGKRYGTVLSFLSATMWLIADTMSGQAYIHPFIPFWNMAVRLLFFLIIMFLLDRIKKEQQRREELILNLRDAREKIRTLRGMLPICAWCKKIRDDKGYWQQVEMYVQEHSDATFTHGICPECAEKLEKEYET